MKTSNFSFKLNKLLAFYFKNYSIGKTKIKDIFLEAVCEKKFFQMFGFSDLSERINIKSNFSVSEKQTILKSGLLPLTSLEKSCLDDFEFVVETKGLFSKNIRYAIDLQCIFKSRYNSVKNINKIAGMIKKKIGYRSISKQVGDIVIAKVAFLDRQKQKVNLVYKSYIFSYEMQLFANRKKLEAGNSVVCLLKRNEHDKIYLDVFSSDVIMRFLNKHMQVVSENKVKILKVYRVFGKYSRVCVKSEAAQTKEILLEMQGIYGVKILKLESCLLEKIYFYFVDGEAIKDVENFFCS